MQQQQLKLVFVSSSGWKIASSSPQSTRHSLWPLFMLHDGINRNENHKEHATRLIYWLWWGSHVQHRSPFLGYVCCCIRGHQKRSINHTSRRKKKCTRASSSNLFDFVVASTKPTSTEKNNEKPKKDTKPNNNCRNGCDCDDPLGTCTWMLVGVLERSKRGDRQGRVAPAVGGCVVLLCVRLHGLGNGVWLSYSGLCYVEEIDNQMAHQNRVQD